ncbi:MAG TPA: amino acid aminotransferase [Sphingomicrobium sp.]|jgi:aromatic-amino-acid transaminase|nr:amino acid aminotransferase [Sphingomicrobium sp.]
MLTTTAPRGLSELEPVTSDSLLTLIALANADSRPEKIDVGVGVFRDGQGRTPILRAVKEAERRLHEQQSTKAYLGGAGDRRFPELLKPVVLGPHAADERIAGLQTPGGCGAIYLAMQLVRTVNPQARVFVGVPTWPNHPPMIDGAGLEIVDYPHLDRDTGGVRFGALFAKLREARSGDVVLLHGCCHNPTGADLSAAEWDQVAELISARGLLPIVDIAYQGLGRGLEEDSYGVRRVLDLSDEALIAQSCDKNFGVYRDRVGCLFVKTRSKEATATAFAHLLQLAREAWSMPPDHGAAAVRMVLEDEALTADWKAELAHMRGRITAVRQRIAAADERLAFVAHQFGMFSMLPLSKDQVESLRERHAIYMADSGRINVVGIADEAIDRFCVAIVETLDSPAAHG